MHKKTENPDNPEKFNVAYVSRDKRKFITGRFRKANLLRIVYCITGGEIAV